MSTHTHARLAAALDSITEAETAQLAVALGSIPGHSGQEQAVGDAVHAWLVGQGIPAERQEVAPGRFNVIGRVRSSLRGSRRGPGLLFDAHLDVSEGGEKDYWGPPFEPGREEDGLLYGKAILNDRAGIAAMLLAQAAVVRGGLRLAGDLTTAAVVGEIGMAPVDEFQGTEYVGKGVGTHHLVAHGGIADYAVVAETTDWGITWIECGAAYFRITIPGEAIYTPRVPTRPFSPAHPNAILRAVPLITALDAWGREYETRNTRQFPVGAVVPKVVIGAIRGGWAPRPNRTAGQAALYVDVRLPPGETPLGVQREIEDVLISAGVEGAVDLYLYRRGYEGRGVEPLVEATRAAHRMLRGSDPPPVPTHVTSMWRDINVFAEVGIPALTFGPPRRPGRLPGENTKVISVADLAACARMYLLIATKICGLIA